MGKRAIEVGAEIAAYPERYRVESSIRCPKRGCGGLLARVVIFEGERVLFVHGSTRHGTVNAGYYLTGILGSTLDGTAEWSAYCRGKRCRVTWVLTVTRSRGVVAVRPDRTLSGPIGMIDWILRPKP